MSSTTYEPTDQDWAELMEDRKSKPPLTATVSLAQKVGLPNYGNAECFLSLSGVTAETTVEEIDQMLDQAGLSWKRIAERIKTKVAEIKQEAGI